MSDEWLSLSEAAELLGVHPSTVRSWADQGSLPVHRTQGGHRRFRRDDVQVCARTNQGQAALETEVTVQNALRRMRFEIAENHLETQDWYAKLDNDAREQYRQSGRSLVFGLITYLSKDIGVTDAEARSLGYEYASRGRRFGLSSVDAARAFIFFRNLLLETILGFYENTGVRSPHAWADMVRKIYTFTDQIMVTLLETYDAYPRGGTGNK